MVAQELAERWRRGTSRGDQLGIRAAKQPSGLAYAQGHWMVEYMNERFEKCWCDCLAATSKAREGEAMPQALGVSREEFYEGFPRLGR